MDLTPNDIRSHEFSSRMRGYDKEDVDSFLEHAASALDTLKQENLRLSMELDSIKSQLAGMREFEDTIKNAAIDARRNADMTVVNARKEAELVLQRAGAEGEKIIGSRSRQVSEMEDQISRLEVMKKSYLSKLRGLINSHLDMLDEIARLGIKRELSTNGRDQADSDERIEVTDSSELERGRFESIATRPSSRPAIRTEEANAAEQIIPVDTGASLAAAGFPSMEHPQSPTKAAALDPELAAALESYTRQAHAHPDDFGMSAGASSKTATAVASAPAPGEFVETNMLAEDVPPGFISHEPQSKPVDPRGTGKLNVPQPAASQDSEPPVPDEAASPEPEKRKKSFDPNDLADELDTIAARFAEEMDKADKG